MRFTKYLSLLHFMANLALYKHLTQQQPAVINIRMLQSRAQVKRRLQLEARPRPLNAVAIPRGMLRLTANRSLSTHSIQKMKTNSWSAKSQAETEKDRQDPDFLDVEEQGPIFSPLLI